MSTAPTADLTRADGSPLRVLVVDDEVNIAELISMARCAGCGPRCPTYRSCSSPPATRSRTGSRG